MERKKLTVEEIGNELAGLNGWTAKDDALVKRLEFKNFAESLAFVNRVGELAEAADHHPDLKLGWGYTEIELTTHDRGGITATDIDLAKKIDKLD
jgi:4a-hydroxytetrahydrobiopterin dehydratase